MLQISILVPLFNEAESLPELTAWIDQVMKTNSFSYELIFINDGSTDASWEVINSLSKEYKPVKGICFARNYGKSAALHEGFAKAQGDVVITMDADLQDSPDEIPALYQMVKEQDYDLVSGWKQKRFDPISKTIPTKLYNAATRKLSGVQLNDFNCGLKAYRKKVVKSIEVYGEMHRYVPVLSKWAGLRNIGEKVVEHRARKYGVTKFGWSRFVNGFLDLLTIFFMGKFGKRPMHFFGLWGSVFFFLGFITFTYLTISKFIFDNSGLTQRPLFFFALTIMIIGTQLFLAGFIGELISRSSADRNSYLIEEKIGL